MMMSSLHLLSRTAPSLLQMAHVTIVAAVPVCQSSKNSSLANIAPAMLSTAVATASTSLSVDVASQLISDVTATCSSATVISPSNADATTSAPVPGGMASCQFSPVTLEKLTPMPNAGARKSSGSRKRQKSRIVTDTPVRAEIKAAQEAKKKSNVPCKRKLNMPEEKSKKFKIKEYSQPDDRADCYTSCCWQFLHSVTMKQPKKPRKQKTCSNCQSRAASNILRSLAYELAHRNDIRYPFSSETKRAGKDWTTGFLRRYQELSLRRPEATSMARLSFFKRVQGPIFKTS